MTAVSRSAEKDDVLGSAGATPVRVSLFDPQAVRAAVDGHDAVVNLVAGDSGHFRELLPFLGRGWLPLVGDHDGYQPYIDAADAARSRRSGVGSWSPRVTSMRDRWTTLIPELRAAARS